MMGRLIKRKLIIQLVTKFCIISQIYFGFFYEQCALPPLTKLTLLPSALPPLPLPSPSP